MENNKFPIIYLEIDSNEEEMGVHCVSFVTKPATEVAWTKFKEENKFKFEKNEMERIVTGPIMVPEVPIYRFSEVIGPFYVKFTKDTILNTMKKYFRDNNHHNVNEEHNPHRTLKDVYLVESFIIGDKVESKLYPDLPEGTWMGSFHVENEQYWNEVIMSDEFGGLSLEGIFDLKYEDEVLNQLFSKIEEVLFSDLEDDDKLNQINNLLNIK